MFNAGKWFVITSIFVCSSMFVITNAIAGEIGSSFKNNSDDYSTKRSSSFPVGLIDIFNTYKTLPTYKAFAIAVNSYGDSVAGWSYQYGSQLNANTAALSSCESNRITYKISPACTVYAEGNAVINLMPETTTADPVDPVDPVTPTVENNDRTCPITSDTGTSTDFAQTKLIIKSSYSEIGDLFNWAEDIYPQYFNPSNEQTFEIAGYLARYYQNTLIYLGTKDERVYVYGDVFGGLVDVGLVSDYLNHQFMPSQTIDIKVNNSNLTDKTYQGCIGDSPVDFVVNGDTLSTLVPELPTGEHNLSVELDEQVINTPVTIVTGATIEHPREYIQESLTNLRSDLESGLADLDPINDAELITVVNEILISLNTASVDALSTEELKLFSELIEVNKLNDNLLTNRHAYRSKRILPGCDINLLSYSLKQAIGRTIIMATVFNVSVGGAGFTGGLSVFAGILTNGYLLSTIIDHIRTIGEITGNCLEPQTWLDEDFDTRKRSVPTSSVLSFQSELEKVVNLKSEYLYPESVQGHIQELKTILNKLTAFLPSSFNTFASNITSDGKIEYRNGADFSVTNISNPLVSLSSVNHNGKSLVLKFKLAEGEDEEQNFTFDLTDNAYDVEPVHISAKISATETGECVTHKGLMWEVKTNDGGLRDKNNTYSWYDPSLPLVRIDNITPWAGTPAGGISPRASYVIGGDCNGGILCDTYHYVQAVNEQSLCGFNDWRMPTHYELITLKGNGTVPDIIPQLIDNLSKYITRYQSHYWSSVNTPFNERSANPSNADEAHSVPFYPEGKYYIESGKIRNLYVRLVR